MNLDQTIQTTIEHTRHLIDRIEKYECGKCNSPRNGERCESCPFGQVMGASVDYILTLQETYVKAGA